jgi:hypothetical protein
MLQGTFRKILLAMLLLAYVGQGVAAANMACQHPSAEVPIAAAPGESGDCSAHMQHTATDPAKNTSAPDCCSNCDCFLGGCSSVALPVVLQIVAPLSSSKLVDGYTDLTSSPFALSLFRPPIFS